MLRQQAGMQEGQTTPATEPSEPAAADDGSFSRRLGPWECIPKAAFVAIQQPDDEEEAVLVLRVHGHVIGIAAHRIRGLGDVAPGMLVSILCLEDGAVSVRRTETRYAS